MSGCLRNLRLVFIRPAQSKLTLSLAEALPGQCWWMVTLWAPVLGLPCPVPYFLHIKAGGQTPDNLNLSGSATDLYASNLECQRVELREMLLSNSIHREPEGSVEVSPHNGNFHRSQFCSPATLMEARHLGQRGGCLAASGPVRCHQE